MGHDRRLQAGEGPHQRVHGAPVAQIAADLHGQPAEPALLAAQGVEVGQRLRRVLMRAVAGVDDRTLGMVGGDAGCALPRVTDHDGVGVALNHPDGVGDALALGRRAARGVGRRDDLATEAQHGRLEGEPRAGAGLVEEAGQDAPLGDRQPPAQPGGDTAQTSRQLVGQLQETLNLVEGEIVDRDEMPSHRVGDHRPDPQREPGLALRGVHLIAMSGHGRGTLLVISGPSGSGKTTIAHAVRDRLGGVFSVSVTTRPRSASEADGREYFFVSEPEFRERVDQGVFLEHACLYGSHQYGTPREPVEKHLAAGDLVILEIDVQGALQVRQAMPEALMVFILPPGDEELLRRLRSRGRDEAASIQRRLAEAKREIDLGRHSGAYDAHVVNDVLEQAIDETCRLVRSRREASTA